MRNAEGGSVVKWEGVKVENVEGEEGGDGGASGERFSRVRRVSESCVIMILSGAGAS